MSLLIGLTAGLIATTCTHYASVWFGLDERALNIASVPIVFVICFYTTRWRRKREDGKTKST